MSHLKQHTNKQTSGWGKRSFKYQSAVGHESEPFQVFIVDPAKDDKPPAFLSYPVARVYDDGTRQMVPWTAELLMDAMQPFLRKWNTLYQTKCFLKVV